MPLFIRDGSWISVKLESVPIELFFLSPTQVRQDVGGLVGGMGKYHLLFYHRENPFGTFDQCYMFTVCICPHRIQFYLQFPCVAKVVQAMTHC